MATVAAEGTGAPGAIDLSGNAGRHRKENVVRGLFFGAAAFSVVISAAIVLSLVGRAFSFAINVDPTALWSDGWFPRRGLYDLRTIVGGTLTVTVISMIVATPLGLGAAIYLSEYAGPRARRSLKPIIEVLAGIPSVVMGYFALAVVAPDLVQRLWGSAPLFTLMAAGIAVGILVTPLVASIAEDAMHAVPSSLREASVGLGARRMTTSLRVVFPAALSGIVAALIVGISRAIGETMVVAMAAGGTGGALGFAPLRPGQTMTGAMASLATGSDQVKGQALTFEALFFVGMLLFLITFALNVMSERFVRRFRERY
jgi:phosphate transport system permease protein